VTTTLEPGTVYDRRAAMVAAHLCPQCGHPTGLTGELHNLYGSHCRAVEGPSECLCAGPRETRRP
jgi:hypothetical protein